MSPPSREDRWQWQGDASPRRYFGTQFVPLVTEIVVLGYVSDGMLVYLAAYGVLYLAVISSSNCLPPTTITHNTSTSNLCLR